MKIAFFNYLNLENGGGAERFITNTAVGLKKRHPELKISVITYQSIKNVNKLRSILKGFDVIYSRNDLREAIILKFLVGNKNLKKLIFGFHTSIYFGLPFHWQYPLLKSLYGLLNYKLLLSKADKFHVVNSFTAKELRCFFKDKEIYKIHNPFDFKQFESNVATRKRRDTRNKGKLNLLWVGRLNWEKGGDVLIKLIKTLNKSLLYKKISWTIIGVGKLEKEIKKLMSEFNNVNSLGFVDNGKLAGIYQVNDLFLSTSRWESFPYTFVEAQTFGLPIISYNIPGANEIIDNELTGYLVNSFEELKSKLEYLIINKNQLIQKNFIKNSIRKLINNEQIYKDLYGLFTGK